MSFFKHVLSSIVLVIFYNSVQLNAFSIYPVSDISEELKKGANVVIRNESILFNVKQIDFSEMTVKVAVTVFEKGHDYEEVRIPYDKLKKIEYIKASIYNKSGTLIRRIAKKDILDLDALEGYGSYSDNRYKEINFEHSIYPYTIIYEYQVSARSTIFYPHWNILDNTNNLALEKSSFTIITPSNIQINYKAINIDISPEKTITESGKNKYHWEVENIKAKKYEPYALYGFPGVLVSPSSFQLGKYKGSLDSWNAYSEFYNKLNSNHNNLSDEMKLEIKKMISNAKTDQEKIEILYKYLQDNMRYVSVQLGIGSWQAFDAAYVEKNKFGDCKALTYFMKAMLEEAGIEACPVLIKSGRLGLEVTEDFAFLNFNHILLNVPSEDCWLECTSKNYPVNYIGRSNHNRNALLISKDEGKLIRMPSYLGKNNRKSSKTKIHLSETGEAKIENIIEYTGPYHDYMRGAGEHYSQEELEQWFSKNTDLPAFKIQKMKITSDDKNPTSTFHYLLGVPRFVSKAGSRLFVPINKLNVFEDVPQALKERHSFIDNKYDYTESDEIVLVIPEGFEVESIPHKKLDLNSDYGSYQIDITVEKNVLTYHRNLEIKAVKLPPEKYDDFRNFYKEIAKADQMKLVLVKKKT